MFLSHYNAYQKTKNFKFIDINDIVGPIVKLTRNLKFQKVYYDIYEIINDDYRLTSIIECCNKRDEEYIMI